MTQGERAIHLAEIAAQILAAKRSTSNAEVTDEDITAAVSIASKIIKVAQNFA